MNDTDLAILKIQLTRHESRKLFPYLDCCGKPWRECTCAKKGNLTIGVGRNLDAKGISLEESDIFLTDDIDEVITGLTASYPWFVDLNGPIQGAFINIGFNLGLERLATFSTFLNLMATKDFSEAATDLETTLWYRQVGQRGRDLVQQLRTGVWV